jgi:hypothetical protein
VQRVGQPRTANDDDDEHSLQPANSAIVMPLSIGPPKLAVGPDRDGEDGQVRPDDRDFPGRKLRASPPGLGHPVYRRTQPGVQSGRAWPSMNC